MEMDKFCPNCGNKLFGTEKFCGKCGYDVSNITQGKSSEKILNEQEKTEVNELDENGQEEQQKDKSSVTTKLAQKQEEQSKIDDTQKQNSSADRKEKLTSKIVWTIGIIVAFIGVGVWGVYMLNQNSHPEASSKIDKSQSKKPKKSSQKLKATKGKVYTTKINKITVGGRREGTDWIIEGTTKAPNNSMMVAILPKKNTVDLSGAAYVSNIAYNTTDDEGGGIAEVHDGRFQIEITPDSSAYYNKNGDKEAVKDNQDIKVKIVAISNFTMKIEDMSHPLPQKLVSEVNRKGKITILTTNHKQGEYYRNWGDDSDEGSSEGSGDNSSSDDASDTDTDDIYADNDASDNEEDDDSTTNNGTLNSDATDNDNSSSQAEENKVVINNAQEAVAAAKKDDPEKDWKFAEMVGDDYRVTAMAKAPENGEVLPYQEFIHPDGTIEK